MKHYDILKNSAGSIRAIKQGWSWPAFFFTGLWALAKQLWGIFALVIVANIGSFAIATFLVSNHVIRSLGALRVLNIVFVIIISGILGMQGNSWLMDKLVSYYKFTWVDAVDAATPEEAKMLYLKSLKKE